MLLEAPEFQAICTDSSMIPADAALLMSALDAGRSPLRDRRTGRRFRLRVQGTLRLFSDHPSAPPWQLYTREANSRSLGFVSPHRLPLGHGGIIELPGSNGGLVPFHCTLLRCREVAPGWYEGAIYFNREQPQFNRER